MNEIKNKIITISGDPASGKSTAVKGLKSQYEKMGYKVEIKSVGKDYRPIVMNGYMRFLEEHPEKKKIIKNPTLAQAQNDPEYSKIIRRDFDTIVDNYTEQYGKKISSKSTPDIVYIIDARLAWQRIPNSFAVRTIIDENVAGQRAFNDQTRGQEDSYASVEDAIKATKERKLGEIERYKARYGVDLTNPNNYDLIIDTTNLTPEQIVNLIIEKEREYREGKTQPNVIERKGFEPGEN